MRSHFEEVRQVELALLFGHLDAAQFHAHALSTMASEATLQQASLVRVRETAGRLAAANAVDAALPLVAALAGECAGCHQASRAVVRLPLVAEPGEDGSLESRMARHQWAADRIWEGLVAPSHLRWRDGLAVLAEDPLPPVGMTEDRRLYKTIERLGQELAEQARKAQTAVENGERTYAFGEMLQVCSDCHVLLRHGGQQSP